MGLDERHKHDPEPTESTFGGIGSSGFVCKNHGAHVILRFSTFHWRLGVILNVESECKLKRRRDTHSKPKLTLLLFFVGGLSSLKSTTFWKNTWQPCVCVIYRSGSRPKFHEPNPKLGQQQSGAILPRFVVILLPWQA